MLAWSDPDSDSSVGFVGFAADSLDLGTNRQSPISHEVIKVELSDGIRWIKAKI